MGGLPDFPATFEEALEEIASKKQLQLRRYEYWGVPIRTLEWTEGGLLKGVQFDYRDADIGVTLRRERTGGRFSFLRWCHNNVPMFPSLLQLQTSPRPPLAKDSSIADYVRTLEGVIEQHQ
jgi:hypothetical protein